jgi:hypothetical protein
MSSCALIEATSHLLGDIALLIAGEARLHVPQQSSRADAGLRCHRGQPTCALPGTLPQILAYSHRQRVLHEGGGWDLSGLSVLEVDAAEEES